MDGSARTQLTLGSEADAVPRARRFAAEALSGVAAATVADAELVVAELVTNALLHAGPPALLRIRREATTIRIEVEDTARSVPISPPLNTESMTGRGLSMVAVVATGWGIDPGDGGGKVVWAELATAPAPSAGLTDPEVDVDALLASWAGDEPAEPLYTVRIGSVPTDLLLAAKGHIDNLVREFTLARAAGETTGEGLPPALEHLIDTVTAGFASARAEIKRQAVEAAERGDAETDLLLTQPASAADAAEAYLAALDEADRYARAASLLTLETPPVHRVFRHWYVSALVDQLRALARGETPPPPPTFPQALAREVTRLATMRESADRFALLQRVTGALTRSRTVPEIAQALVTGTVAQLGALSSSVYLLGDDGVLRSVASEGGQTRWTDKFHEVPLDADLPGAVVFNTGEPLVLRGLAQIAEQFPQIGSVYRTERTLHVVPLIVGERRLGVLSVAFPMVAELDDRNQVSFVAALADSLAQSLERAQALQRASEANEALSAANARLAFLAEASVALSGSLDYQATLEAVGRLVVPRLADWCVVSVVEDGELRNVDLRHADPERAAWGREMAARYPPRMDAPTGPPQVLRTGRSEVYAELPPQMLTDAARDDEHLAILHGMGVTSALFVPLVGRGGTVLGTLTLVHAESGRRYGPDDVAFTEDIARRAALALETATTYRDQSGRLATVTRVAEAAQHAILAPPPARVGPVKLAARYVSAAAAAKIGGDLYEVVARPGGVRLLIGDVRGKGLTAVRLATVVLGEFRGAAADVDDLAGVAVQIDRRLRPYLGDEDFVTAMLAEIGDDGRFAVASCGHPPPLLGTGEQLATVPVTPSVPLGMGASPAVTQGQLRAGDRMLLHTDGLTEARAADGHVPGLPDLVAGLAGGEPGDVLDRILAALQALVGPDLGDDLALLLAEYHGS
jgi:serine phosphatase RsbU (regulator of sigma subunit)